MLHALKRNRENKSPVERKRFSGEKWGIKDPFYIDMGSTLSSVNPNLPTQITYSIFIGRNMKIGVDYVHRHITHLNNHLIKREKQQIITNRFKLNDESL